MCVKDFNFFCMSLREELANLDAPSKAYHIEKTLDPYFEFTLLKLSMCFDDARRDHYYINDLLSTHPSKFLL
jgi:hypothetical protein